MKPSTTKIYLLLVLLLHHPHHHRQLIIQLSRVISSHQLLKMPSHALQLKMLRLSMFHTKILKRIQLKNQNVMFPIAVVTAFTGIQTTLWAIIKPRILLIILANSTEIKRTIVIQPKVIKMEVATTHNSNNLLYLYKS